MTGGSSPGPAPHEDPPLYLTFALCGDFFAISIQDIKEIVGWSGVTQVPRAPEFVRGVSSLRGRVLPVIDLRARFGRGPSAVTARTALIIIGVSDEDCQLDLGMMVDSIDALLEIAPAEIRPPPPFGALLRSEFVKGVGKVAGRRVPILNLAVVLSVEEMASFFTMGDGASS